MDISKKIKTLLPDLLRLENSLDKKLITDNFNLKDSQIKKLSCKQDVNLEINLKEIFSDPLGKILLGEFNRMNEMVDFMDIKELDEKQGFGNKDYWRSYLRQSLIRVYHLIKSYQEYGFAGGVQYLR